MYRSAVKAALSSVSRSSRWSVSRADPGQDRRQAGSQGGLSRRLQYRRLPWPTAKNPTVNGVSFRRLLVVAKCLIFLEHDFDRVRAAAAFRCAAERGIDVAHPRTGCGPCDCGPYLRLAEDVAAAHNHDALLAEQAERIMIESKPLTAPLQAAARPREAAADICANTCPLRINIYGLRNTAPFAHRDRRDRAFPRIEVATCPFLVAA